MNLESIGQTLSVWLVPLVLAITVHEAAHAWTADRLGDDTARRLGRVTFNPVRHVDPFGTLVLPGILLLVGTPFLFGYAKPVPVAFHRLNDPKRDMVWVALAGPGVNIAMALLAGWAMHPFGELSANPFTMWVWSNLHNFITINVALAVFNMLPIPPLDGGRVVTGLLPDRLAYRYARLEPYGMVFLLLMIVVAPMVARELGSNLNPLGLILTPAFNAVYALVTAITGWA
jgi:Zn-dependent protease